MQWTTTLEHEDLPYTVELDFVASDAGPECRSVRFTAREGGEPISARRMREILIAECIQLAIATATASEIRDRNTVTYALGGVDDLGERIDLAHPVNKRMADKHLREVARVYQEDETGKPTQAVQDYFNWVTYSTAARWVMDARRRGFVPPTKRGQRRERR